MINQSINQSIYQSINVWLIIASPTKRRATQGVLSQVIICSTSKKGVHCTWASRVENAEI